MLRRPPELAAVTVHVGTGTNDKSGVDRFHIENFVARGSIHTADSKIGTPCMRVTYCLKFEDYYDASQVRTAKARLVSRFALLVMVALLGVVMMRLAAASVWRNYLSLGLMIVLLAFLPEAVRWLNKRYLKYADTRATSADRAKEISVDIEEDGIQMVGVPNKQEWSYFSNYSESAHAFILYRSSTIEAILPKRAFSRDSLSNCREIFKANIAPR